MDEQKKRFEGAFGELAANDLWSGRKPWPDIEVKCCKHGVKTCSDPTCKKFEETKK